MTLNTGYYLQAYTSVTLILCGLVQYFTDMQSVLRVPFFLTLLIVELLVMQTRDDSLYLDAQGTIILALYFLFLVLAGASTLIQGGITVMIVALKNGIAPSLVMIRLLLGFYQELQIRRAARYPYWVFYARIPVVIYQILLVVPQRVAVRGEDEKRGSVVGTSGSDPMGGGDTATMGLFCLLIMLLKVSECEHGLTTFEPMALYIALSIGLCIIDEVEFVILLSPIFLVWVQLSPSYVKNVSKVNLRMLLVIVAGILLLINPSVVILAYYYSTMFGDDPSKSSSSIFIDSLDYIFDPNYIMSIGELGCFTTFLFWLKNNDLRGLSETLFGCELDATDSGSMVSPGFLNIICNLILNSVSPSILLWEVGVIGTLLFIGLLIYILKVCQSKPLLMLEQLDQQDLQSLSFAPAFNAFAISCLISLPYSQTLMVTPVLQSPLYLSLGSGLVIRRTALRCVRQLYGPKTVHFSEY